MRKKFNQDKVADKINKFKLVGVDAIGDDGSVCVQINGDKNRVVEVANIIFDKVGDITTTDGVQDGEIWINGNDCNIHDDLHTVAKCS